MHRPLGNISGVKDTARMLDEEGNLTRERLAVLAGLVGVLRGHARTSIRSLNADGAHEQAIPSLCNAVLLQILGGPQVLLVERISLLTRFPRAERQLEIASRVTSADEQATRCYLESGLGTVSMKTRLLT